MFAILIILAPIVLIPFYLQCQSKESSMPNYLNKFSLKNKTAFVVGGLGLIGAEISRALISAGAKVVMLDINEDKGKALENENQDKSNRLIFRTFDCSVVDQLDNNFSILIDEYGCMDIFINCSYPRTKDWGNSSFKDIKLETFQKNIVIHMNSYAWLARLAAEAMVKAGNDGSIIQLGSIYGLLAQDLSIYNNTKMHENMTYATIKGGIINLTRQMASYYGQYNIRVNTLCPGGLKGHSAGKSDTQDPVFIKNYSKKVPLKRLGYAEEIVPMALFLASEASSYITGATVMVDGGWTIV